MKKNYLKLMGSFVLFFFVCAGCTKELKEIDLNKSAADNSFGKLHKDGCNLVTFDWVDASKWTFHYNEKGLADKWVIDYGDGFPEEETMIYSRDNRLIQANETYQGANNVYLFTYSGRRVTKVTWSTSAAPGQQQVSEFTYNYKGQITRQDDNANDIHTLMFYDRLGNTTRTDIYFGTDPYFSDIYTFDKPVRNALLLVPGIPFGFPFFGTGNFLNSRWFTSNTGLVYDNGTPIVLYDYDPAKTVFKTGLFDFPLSVTYYDNITQGPGYINLMYSCGGKGNMADDALPQSDIKMLAAKQPAHFGPMPLLRGSVQSIKEQIKKLRDQSQAIKK